MTGHGGIGTYIRTIVPALIDLRHEWTFSILGDAGELRDLIPGSARFIACEAPIYGIQEQVALARAIPRDTTVFWAPHYNIPVFRRLRMVVTVHDLAHLRLPEYDTPARRLYARAMFQHIRRRAAAIVFVSEFSRGEFVSLVGTPRGRSAVVHTGIPVQHSDTSRTTVAPIQPPYFVYVGNAKPHKNLGTLLDAFDQLRRSADVRLAVIGQTENLRTADDSAIRRLKSTSGVSVLGAVTSEQLVAYLRSATALVFPSLYEGFGLPPLEAMALGCPAIVARSASLPEICGDAATYFDPMNSGALCAVMRRLIEEPSLRADLVAKGRQWVRRFDVRETAGAVAGIIASAAG